MGQEMSNFELWFSKKEPWAIYATLAAVALVIVLIFIWFCVCCAQACKKKPNPEDQDAMLVRDTEIGGTQVMNFDDGPSIEMTNTNL